MVLCVTMAIMAKISQNQLLDMILLHPPASIIRFLNEWGILASFFIWCLFILILLWSYAVSRDLVGAFERILRDLDDIIAGREQKHLYARKNDALANALLKRLNTLVDLLPKGKPGSETKK